MLPHAFTEHGAIMAANVLNSPGAVQMSVLAVHAFVKIRAALTDTRELAAVEAEIKSRLDVQEAATVEVLQRNMRIWARSSVHTVTLLRGLIGGKTKRPARLRRQDRLR
jgi:hypothetical protein